MSLRAFAAIFAVAILWSASGCNSCSTCGPAGGGCLFGGCGGPCPYGMQPPHPCAGKCCTLLDTLGAGPRIRQMLERPPRVASPCGNGPAPWWAYLDPAAGIGEQTSYVDVVPGEFAPDEPLEIEPSDPSEMVPPLPVPLEPAPNLIEPEGTRLQSESAARPVLAP